MVINLKKYHNAVLEMDHYDLSLITIGLGWDVMRKRGFFQLFAWGAKDNFDLDVMAFLLDCNGKVANDGDENFEGGDIIFYNNPRHSSGAIHHTGDNQTGEGEDDDEQLVVKLNRMEAKYNRIVFWVFIHDGLKKRQSFGQLENAYIRAYDAKGHEIFRFNLSHDSTFAGKCSMIFGEFHRHNDGWRFKVIGKPYETDDFQKILEQKYL